MAPQTHDQKSQAEYLQYKICLEFSKLQLSDLYIEYTKHKYARILKER